LFKAQVRHRNFTECMCSLVCVNTFNEKDTIIQMARCSFDIHVQEILGTLMIGATLIMLHPKGTIDFDYLSEILDKKQITYIHTVPSLLHSFFTFLEKCNNRVAVKYLRSLCSSGE
jgi:non-ribosomal peptide synthetase component F